MKNNKKSQTIEKISFRKKFRWQCKDMLVDKIYIKNTFCL